jgi:hypothetical protein
MSADKKEPPAAEPTPGFFCKKCATNDPFFCTCPVRILPPVKPQKPVRPEPLPTGFLPGTHPEVIAQVERDRAELARRKITPAVESPHLKKLRPKWGDNPRIGSAAKNSQGGHDVK